MQFTGEMDLQALAQLNGSDEDPGALVSRAIDSNGDGRPDLYLVDADSDGSVDNVVRAFDTNGDGVNDTFLQYNENGGIESIGRVNPETGELDVIYEEPGIMDEILDSLGLAELESPEEALFTSFEDPYIVETFGTYGEDVPDVYEEPEVVSDFTLSDVSEEEAAATETDLNAGPSAASDDNSEEHPPEAAARIVEIEDRSGGDASSLWAKVDKDGDGLADYDTQLQKTSTGEYYGDINQDGYSEDVATDIDMDGRIDTVDTTGEGSSSNSVSAEQVVDPESDHLVDHGSADDTLPDSADTDTGTGTGSEYSAGTADAGSMDAGADSSYDSGSTVDMGSDDTV